MDLVYHFSQNFYTITPDEFQNFTARIKNMKINSKKLRSVNSLILKYYLYNNMIDKAEQVLSIPTTMKRDYLNFIEYLFKHNDMKYIEFFMNVLDKFNIMEKDVMFLINNKMFDLLFYLRNHYIILSLPHDDYNIPYENFIFSNPIRNYHNMLNYVSGNFSNIKERHILDNILIDVDIVIDGGNVAHSDSGILNYKYIFGIIDNTIKKFKNPLLIIHQRHMKNSKITDYIKKTKLKVFVTPYGVNDDHYIIYSMIHNDCYVLTRDNFKDHIFDITTNFDYINNEIYHYVEEKTITYSNKTIANPPNYTRCIQVVSDYVYIPTESGFKRFNLSS
jgi:hypothetical protein